MDAYAYVVEQLRRDDFQRLRAYASDGHSKFTTWLVIVTRRLCLDHLRERYGRSEEASPRSRAAHRVRRQLVDLLADDLESAQAIPAATTDDPETDVRKDELHGALDAALRRLDPRDRLLLKLRFDDGLPAREIDRIVGLGTPFHVYRRLHSVLTALRKSLSARGVESPEP